MLAMILLISSDKMSYTLKFHYSKEKEILKQMLRENKISIVIYQDKSINTLVFASPKHDRLSLLEIKLI
jgi:hypothetical protein